MKKIISYSFVFLIGIFMLSVNVYASDCPLGEDVTKDLSGLLRILKIVGPLLMIALTSFEAIKALTKGDAAGDIKKVGMRFAKRLIYVILLFFIPVIVDQIMQLTNVWGADGTCGPSDLEGYYVAPVEKMITYHLM